ncbi:hypothetical protein, partial [Shewanella sp. 38A_GOM-205m]|uniref:hypothetical protein n=1 Tax=Shewanella sp. 38A_GOM-205m TaxID=1380363 RepID=UPI0004917EDC
GDFGYVGVSLGMQGALDKQSPLPGVVWNTTTLGRWHSGYHGFKPSGNVGNNPAYLWGYKGL